MATAPADATAPPDHSAAFRLRRFLNWFPMGLTYALLYMGRYNLTVSKNALGELMTKEDFSAIFATGTVVYALAFLLNGPLTDRFGGKKALLTAATGAGLVNLLMGTYLAHAIRAGQAGDRLRLAFSLLYGANMYFQSFGAVAIVKVNAHWFHVRERGSFSGIFGTMISSGLFFAFTVNSWLLEFFARDLTGVDRTLQTRVVFLLPGALLLVFALIEAFLLKDRPAQAGLRDFDTGDGSRADGPAPPTLTLMKRVLTHPVILTVALVEFCTGVLRNGVMHWYPIYAKEVLALPSDHYLVNGHWGSWRTTVLPFLVAAAALFLLAARWPARRRPLVAVGGLLFLVPFLQGGWGGILMVAGIVGGIVAGFVSDLFFQSRRIPAAGGLYALLLVCTVVMTFVLGQSTNLLADARTSGLRSGDRVVAIHHQPTPTFPAARRAFACVPAACAAGAFWDEAHCLCASHGATIPPPAASATIAVTVERNGERLDLDLPDPAYDKGTQKPKMRAGDGRELKVSPVLTLSPYLLGAVVFLLSLGVIGTHGLLSGTATMDFGGKQGAATAVAMIDGFVYLGTALQSIALGWITSRDWTYWPWFLAPFALAGLLLMRRIWDARPGQAAH